MRKVSKFLWKHLILSQTSPGFCLSEVQVILKHCGKRRNCPENPFSESVAQKDIPYCKTAVPQRPPPHMFTYIILLCRNPI